MPASNDATPRPRRRPRIAIAGAGPGGLCMGIQLKLAGFDDFVILDKAAGVGGTWWHNRYPGAACDIQSHLYSFSFEIKKDWTRPYARQPEIQAYFQHCVRKFGLEPHLRLNTALQQAHWDEERSLWRLVTEHGDELEAEVVVSALGMFNELHWPDIPGIRDFRGTRFHSARWDHDHDLAGERVGVIGSAASAVQFVPEIAPGVRQLHLFQRTANWVLPKEDDPFTPEQLAEFRDEPRAALERRQKIWDWVDAVITFSNPEALEASEKLGRAAIAEVTDPELRRRLTPSEPFGCKRPLISNDYYATFNRSNVELVTDPIERITSDAIVTADGRRHQVDTIVVATGFQTTRFLSAIEMTGRGGRRLSDAWSDGAQAYLGITTAGFPNLFMLYGPNTNNGSILYMLECQVDYTLRHIQRIVDDHLAWIDVQPEAMERYNQRLQEDMEQVEVWQAGCNGYYRSPSGRIVTQWPHTMAEFRERTSRADLDAYEVRHAASG